MKKPAPYLIVLLLLVAVFSLATLLQPRAARWSSHRDSDTALKAFLGDGRRLFANHFFIKADIYFHSGYYPSIFDQAQVPKNSRHMTAQEGSSEEEEHEKQMSFLGRPKDWMERFGRHFQVTEHTHLEHGNEREILPWLRMSAELDPQRIDTYTVAAYWLRVRLGKVAEAEQFLREGVRNNPESFELLFEMGRLYDENYHDTTRARSIWELALRRWREQEPNKEKPNLFALEEITLHLGRLEERAGNFDRAIDCLEQAKTASPNPAALQQQIDELKQKAAAAHPLPVNQPPASAVSGVNH